MGKAANKARVAVLQRLVGGTKEPRLTLFLSTVDASIPDPANPQPPADLSDAAVVAIFLDVAGRRVRIERKAGESFPALKQRAMKQYPDQRVFFKCYMPLEM